MRKRSARAMVGFLAALLLAGCGARGAGGPQPSALDPATAAPASTIAYVELTVRPQGALRDAIEGDLSKLLGSSPDAKLRGLADKLLAKVGTSYAAVRPWLGQRIALVVTALSPAGIAVIAPTDDPAAARAFVDKLPGPFGGAVDGHFAVIGGPAALQAVGAAVQGNSLARVPAFAAAMATAPAGAVLRAYAALKPLLSAYLTLPALQRLLRAGVGLGGALGRAEAKLARLPGNPVVSAGLGFTARRIELDLAAQGTSRRHPGPPSPGVETLPAGTWLALDTGGSPASATRRQLTAKAFQLGFSSAARARGLGGAALGPTLTRAIGVDFADLVGLVGPFKLAVSGTTLASASAALALRPSDPAAARRLLSAIEPKLGAAGTATRLGAPGSFRFTDPKLLGHSLTVLDQGARILARFGPGSAAPTALAPAGATLASDPGFRRADAALAGGSRAALYISFPQLLALVRSSPKAASASDRRVEAVLGRLAYLIAGGSGGAIRVVLGLS